MSLKVYTAANGRGLGQPAARMLHAAPPEVQDAYQLHTLHRLGHTRRIGSSSGWRERGGGFVPDSDMGFHIVRARLPSHVRNTAGRQSCEEFIRLSG